MLTARHRPWPPALVLAGSLIVAASRAAGATITVEVEANRPAELVLPSAVDDMDFRDPRGCNQPGSFTRRFQRKVIVENIGNTPLAAVELVVNGQDWSHSASITQTLDLPKAPGAFARRFYDFWINAQFHASSGFKAQEDAWCMLGFWGYTLCGENVQALARFMTEHGISARQVSVNGHLVAEYYFDGKWNVLDADQHAFYPALDNRTLASAEEIRDDPFLALRVKPFGKYAAFKLSNAQYNSALFERLTPRERKAMKFEEVRPAVRQDLLRPGESVSYLPTLDGEPIGKTNLDAWSGAQRYSLGTMQYSLLAEGRVAKDNLAEVESSFPILRVTNQSKEETVKIPRDEMSFAQKMPTSGPQDRLAVTCQRSQVSSPLFRKGRNSMTLRAQGAGKARVSVEYEVTGSDLQPVAQIEPSPRVFAGPPSFELRLPEGADMIWWQLTVGADFQFLIPNFERVQPAAKRVQIDPLSATFFSPGDRGRFRFKVRKAGVWSDWSKEAAFELQVPAAPSNAKISGQPGNRVRLEWSGGAAEEYLIFASDRLDFLPEVFAAEEIEAMDHVKVTKSRLNRNLVAKTTETSAELTITGRFLRVVARNGQAYSAPSALLRVPDELAQTLPVPRVLQCRAERVDNPNSATGYQDVYRSVEMELPLKSR